ncbi:unnamed protein product [Oppiella nova]|uniref:UDP-glycosyltransferase n=1 Tax=Oppiella nova TaxID=334625 RepID=A0A7R9LVD9_9ACAR|nr:unnamed protein product [Oppiella nova]CAG2167328.1 unnamed protein product [Oppiella nova]
MSKRSLNVLFIPMDGTGHVNACLGIAEQLIESGHKVSFLMNNQWRGKLSAKYGITEITHESVSGRQTGGDPALEWALVFQESGMISSNGSLEKMLAWYTKLLPLFMKYSDVINERIESTIESLKPDVIFMDQVICLPAVERAGIPWVWICSFNPLFLIDDERTPPKGSGLPVNAKNEWKAFRQVVIEKTYDMWKTFNDFIVGKGLPALDVCQYFHRSPYLNVYPFPQEVDYTDIRPIPDKHLQLDNLMRKDKGSAFYIPVPLLDKPGKLIYLGLGSMVSSDLANMKRLIAILGKSRHRFIVSKGPLHDKYDLPDNMWGQQSVPQIQVLPVVDLVVTHGGNNTVTESLYFGKPMIVLPVFADQYDNAQRLHELGSYLLRYTASLCSNHYVWIQTVDTMYS